MDHRGLSLIVKADIIIIGICGVLMCAVWYPFSISLTAIGISSDVAPTASERLAFWLQLSFYWITSLPCFLILVIAWTVSSEIKKDNALSNAVMKKVKTQGMILLADIAVFLIGNIVFLLLGWNDFAVIYFIFIAIGLVFVSGLYVLWHYIKVGVQLKEETEGLI